MWFIIIKRIFWAIKFGWLHTGQISKEYYVGHRHLALFLDFFVCFLKCGIKSSQYKKQMLWKLDKTRRRMIIEQFKEANKKKNEWEKDFFINRNFLIKYMSFRYEKSWLKEKRNRAYTRRYNAGTNLYVEHDVNLSRQHYLEGTITIGNDVLLAKHVFIDYSGFVEIGNNVSLSDGVVIESHSHVSGGVALKGKGALQQTRLVIEEGVSIGSKSVILDTCNKIGRHARIGAGSVIRCNVPAYSIVIGNPAKIIGFVLTPEEVEEVEDSYPESERISIEKYRKDYQKYFVKRIKENIQYTRL